MYQGQRVHFIGIGGYGMSGLAQVLLAAGASVSGSDLKESERTERLRAAGASIHIGHDARLVHDAHAVVYNTDIPAHNPELQEARRLQLNLLHRSDLLARLLNVEGGIAVTGTHGKTTTTAMIGLLLVDAGLDPTVIIGADVQALGGNARVGRGSHVVAEACESDRSFLRYRPGIAVTTNVEREHLEFYDGDFAQVLAAFAQFLDQVRPGGLAVLCADDPNLRTLGQRLAGAPGAPRIIWYGLEAGADWTARAVTPQEGGMRFEAVCRDQVLGLVNLGVPGRHNVQNALAALAVGAALGVGFDRMAATLAAYRGASRRFEQIAATGGVAVIDDYAHHPTEIRATLAAARPRTAGRLIAVFQPQRYTRTQLLMQEFAGAFSEADLTVLTEIYAPPGQEAIAGVSSAVLADLIRQREGRPVELITDKEAIVRFLLASVRPGDTVLTMGAGDIWQVARELGRRLQENQVG